MARNQQNPWDLEFTTLCCEVSTVRTLLKKTITDIFAVGAMTIWWLGHLRSGYLVLLILERFKNPHNSHALSNDSQLEQKNHQIRYYFKKLSYICTIIRIVRV